MRAGWEETQASQYHYDQYQPNADIMECMTGKSFGYQRELDKQQDQNTAANFYPLIGGNLNASNVRFVHQPVSGIIQWPRLQGVESTGLIQD
jgi:hypothetical protein